MKISLPLELNQEAAEKLEKIESIMGEIRGLPGGSGKRDAALSRLEDLRLWVESIALDQWDDNNHPDSPRT